MGRVLQADVQAGRLIQPFELTLDSDFSYDLVCQKESAERPKIKAFCDWLEETVNLEASISGVTAGV